MISSRSIITSRAKKGRGLGSVITSALKNIPIGTVINRAIDHLPIELHLLGYQFCGGGTKLKKRLARGDKGINKLDQACKEHDIAYSKFSDNSNRSIADRALAEKAWQRVTSSDASLGEKAAALTVAAAMKAKTAIGGGRRRRHQKNRTKKQKIGGKINKRKVGNKKRSKKNNLWTMIRTGKGLYLKPYHRVY